MAHGERRYEMSDKVLKYILRGRGWSELPCSRTSCLLKRPIEVGDRVVSHGVRPRKTRRLMRIYHEVCYDTLPVDCTLIRRYCPLCQEETEHDTEKWRTYTVCTNCGVLIPWER